MQKKQQIQLYLFTIKKHEMLEKIHTQTSRENICGFFIENMQNIGCFTQTNIKYVFLINHAILSQICFIQFFLMQFLFTLLSIINKFLTWLVAPEF